MPYKFIAIEGNIGAGKTTLASALAKELHACLVLETFKENKPLLKFYEHLHTPMQHTYAFATELQFLIDRFVQLKEYSAHYPCIVSDYAPEKSRLFAKLNLSSSEYAVYNDVYQSLLANVPQPDCIIFLERNTQTLENNIKKRARDYEQALDSSYLEKINQAYQHYLQNVQGSIRIIILHQRDSVAEMIDCIKNELIKRG
jgi:deoxyadenosine/deoxycytidine kinase